MQYTGSSFAEMLVKYFSWVLLPQTNINRPRGFFASSASFESDVPDTVLTRRVSAIPFGGAALLLVPAHPTGKHSRLFDVHSGDLGCTSTLAFKEEVCLQFLLSVFHILVVLALPPLLLGVINRTKAYMAGRTGAPFVQPYYELFRLMNKGSVFSRTTTWIFLAGPVVGVAAIFLAALMIPLGSASAPFSFTGDLIVFAYLLGLARFFTMSAALDTGSAFEGMGAAREATFACLAEPVLFFGLLVLSKVTGHLSLASLLGGQLTREWEVGGAAMLLVLFSWFIVLLVENCRIPFDDPNTHLELTMIHEVMVLDHSGPPFGMILYSASLKLFVFAAMVVRLAIPLQTGVSLINWVLFIAAVLGLAVVVGIVESIMARLRLIVIPNLLMAAGVLSAFGLVLLLSQP